MIGQTVSHYKIVRQLGAGGMGVVYAAEDPRLGREVALKFVPEELAHDPHALERLRSEARTASSLNHINICTIYDIGEHDGRPFIVMELLTGQTLRERMGSRPLKVHETLDIGIQSADALYWAHSRDIIHRDIKPANLFLVEHGPLKILDFGLAKIVQSKLTLPDMTVAPTIDLTAVGVALGTVAYMSPEQVTGESLDRRTDLFSLGVVLYECATGQQPFRGKTSAVVLASILTQVPTPPVQLNNEIPIRLQEIIHNCLEKDRELRYQDAAALRTDLKRLKRDLESGASGVVRTMSVLATGAVAVPNATGSTETVAVPPADSRSTKTLQSGATASVGSDKSRGLVLAGVGTVVVAAIVAGVLLTRVKPDPAAPAAPTAIDGSRPSAEASANVRVAVERATSSLAAGNFRAALVFAEEALRGDPTHAEAAQIRNEATTAIARFDEAIVNANKALAAGDADAATRALNAARAIDPGSTVLADVSARLVAEFSAQADSARRAAAAAETARAAATAAARRPSSEPPPATRVVQTAPPLVTPPPVPAPATTVAENAVPSAPQPRPTPVEAVPPVTPPVARGGPPGDRRPPAGPPVEDDDAAIRQVIATYARAIETQDVVLFRTVKPNLTPLEQRRVEDGFRAGLNQKVNITIQSVELHLPLAIVKAHRHDTIQARGRGQVADSEQTFTLLRTPSGWIIRDIGR